MTISQEPCRPLRFTVDDEFAAAADRWPNPHANILKVSTAESCISCGARAARPNSAAARLPGVRGNALAAPLGDQDNPQPNECCATAIDGPPNLSGHKTTRQDIDALKEPNGPHHHHQDTHDVQNDSH